MGIFLSYQIIIYNEEINFDIVSLIPDDWLHWNDVELTPEEIRYIYIDFLCKIYNFIVILFGFLHFYHNLMVKLY